MCMHGVERSLFFSNSDDGYIAACSEEETASRATTVEPNTTEVIMHVG
jgi:hypothetical protein